MPTIKELRARTPKGYNLAMEVPLNYDVRNAADDFMTDKAEPVLKEAEGGLGVLRALDLPNHRPGILGRMAEDGTESKLLHLVFYEENQELAAVIHIYTFIVRREGYPDVT